MDAAKPVGCITLPASDEELESEEVDRVAVTNAQKLTGGLLWLSGRTRPDIACAVSRMSSASTSRPNWALKVGKRILRYLLGTKNHGLRFAFNFEVAKQGIKLSGYADASCDPPRKPVWCRYLY